MTETAPVATGLLKYVTLCAETTWGVAATSSSTSAYYLRRVSSDVALKKATFRSNEIQPDRQIHDFRHGEQSVSGTIRGELSPLTYESVFNQILAGTFAAGSSTVTSVAVTAAVAGNPGTAALLQNLAATPSWQTLGFRIGNIITMTGYTGSAAPNNSRYIRITGMTQTASANDTLILGVAPNNAAGSTVENQNRGLETLVSFSPAISISVSLPGKVLVTPAAGSLNDQSFSVEHWFSDVAQSELFNGCRASRMSVSLPPTGLSTVDIDVMGQSLTINTAQYFTSASSVTTTAVVASVNGIMRVNGVDYAIITGCNFNINANYTPEAVVGSNVTPYLFPGWQDITGSITALFPDEQLNTAFLNESLISMHIWLTISNSVNANFLSFYFPSVKLTSGTKDDKPGAIVGTYGFQALHNVAADGNTATTTNATTLLIQDSQAV